MLTNFRALTLSYKSAPVEIREAVALSDQQCQALLAHLKDVFDMQELFILSTCNRTEVYYSAGSVIDQEIIKMLCLSRGIADFKTYIPYFEVIDTLDLAIQHLFYVSIGLESQVVGDIQIINQVKNAYQWSANESLAGPFLHRLLHTIFFTNKRVVQETHFRDGAASVSYAAVELVADITSEIEEPKVLVIGLGEIGADVCRNFANTKIENITLTNRTYEKAHALGTECGYKVALFENVWEEIAKADVVISALVRDEPFITKAQVKELNLVKHKFFIDLAMPRSIDPTVETVPGALVYNIDDIKAKADEALEQRINAIPKVKEIVAESIAEFNDWSREMVVSPTIQKLKNALEQIRQEEIARFAKQLDDDQSKTVEAITRNMMQKIIKMPVLQLKAACKRGEAETLIDVLNDLFDLEKQKTV